MKNDVEAKDHQLELVQQQVKSGKYYRPTYLTASNLLAEALIPKYLKCVLSIKSTFVYINAID